MITSWVHEKSVACGRNVHRHAQLCILIVTSYKLHERNACTGHRVAWKIKIIIRNKWVLDSTSSSEFLTNKWPSYTDKVVWGRMSTVDDKSYLYLLCCSVIIHTGIIRGICWIQTTLIVFYLRCFVSNRESITVDI